jgi:hypothetical protein
MNSYSLLDLVEFVLLNRGKSKPFSGESVNQIAVKLTDALSRNGLCIDYDPSNGNVAGIVIFTEIPNYQLLHIETFLISRKTKNVMLRFLQTFKTLYPDYDIQAYRKDLLIRYKNTARLCNLLKRFSS